MSDISGKWVVVAELIATGGGDGEGRLYPRSNEEFGPRLEEALTFASHDAADRKAKLHKGNFDDKWWVYAFHVDMMPGETCLARDVRRAFSGSDPCRIDADQLADMAVDAANRGNIEVSTLMVLMSMGLLDLENICDRIRSEEVLEKLECFDALTIHSASADDGHRNQSLAERSAVVVPTCEAGAEESREVWRPDQIIAEHDAWDR